MELGKLAVLGMALGMNSLAFAQNPAVSSSTPSEVPWQEYHNWPVIQREAVSWRVAVSDDFDNKYISEIWLNRSRVTVYVDDLKNPTVSVGEYEVLGTTAVLRNFNLVTPRGPVPQGIQIQTGGKWVGVIPDTISLYLMDPPKFLREGILDRVMLTARPLDETKPPLEVVLVNKEKALR